jgi:hypothetical protein
LATAGDASLRTDTLLLRLERLTRDSGATSSHPRVLEWLSGLQTRDPRILTLVLRRQAEARARAGDADGAEDLAKRARSAAAESGEAELEAMAVATTGAVALFRADWIGAERALGEARTWASTVPWSDQEELARLDHNLGVVLLYRHRLGEATLAFERALAAKRALGDLAGCRYGARAPLGGC